MNPFQMSLPLGRVNYERRLTRRIREGRTLAVRTDRTDHGTHRCYVGGCRCDPCTDAEARYSYLRKHMRSV